MSAILSRLKPLLMVVCVLTGMAIIVGLTQRFASPAMELRNVMHQARYELLVWRLCLYTAGIVSGFSLYRRLPVQNRPRLKRIAGWALVLLVVNEASNLLQQGSGT
ncbi:Uncharacterised protein [Klebsiella michiganensis]|uniref:hypothetical protein n=1 Tax=Klebsiella michiganensis TaxID=1134687 RepID=UPI000DF92566|nr:hypothetical protein [Klebsiella michiganensis]MBA8306158.1 hypothetical protein [Klebsiella michiganensis]MBW5931901.1 hypothetical protein [Klebsiella michiganensis]MBW5933806.1 hypothetical protein [Klebsiella michiganensis]MBX4818556.1 hypothetical protein [Klebsiella michiganensis]QLP35719.1 hypothetical protein HVX57_09605 [Klebsiella michiganensis]